MPAISTSRKKKRVRQSHIFAKEKHGHYVEPRWCSQRLFMVENFGGPGLVVWDPACGWGHILETGLAADYRTVGSDVVDRLKTSRKAVKFQIADFLEGEPAYGNVTSIVCNPPFDYVEEFCERALELATYKVAMLCLLRRLPAARWLEQLPLEHVYLLSPRPSMPPGSWIEKGNKPGGGTQDFCWLVFNKMTRPQTRRLAWLHRDIGERSEQ